MYVLKQNLWNLSIDNAPVALSIEYKMFDPFLSNPPFHKTFSTFVIDFLIPQFH